MPVPVETHCEKDFTRCKSTYFDVLVSNLASAEGDATKEKDAQEKYESKVEFVRDHYLAQINISVGLHKVDIYGPSSEKVSRLQCALEY